MGAFDRIVVNLVDYVDFEEVGADSFHQDSTLEVIVQSETLALELYVDSWVVQVFRCQIPSAVVYLEVHYQRLVELQN